MRSKSRRKARETALKVLYECEVGGGELDEAIEIALEEAKLSPDLGDYVKLLVHGVADHQEGLDEEIEELLTKYDLMRVAAIDRNVLRLAAFEIEHVPYIPPKVSINEAIEIAKKYSTIESGRFVNGVLGKFLKNGERERMVVEAEEEPAAAEVLEIEETTVEEDSKEAKEALRLGAWKLRSEEPPVEATSSSTE